MKLVHDAMHIPGRDERATHRGQLTQQLIFADPRRWRSFVGTDRRGLLRVDFALSICIPGCGDAGARACGDGPRDHRLGPGAQSRFRPQNRIRGGGGSHRVGAKTKVPRAALRNRRVLRGRASKKTSNSGPGGGTLAMAISLVASRGRARPLMPAYAKNLLAPVRRSAGPWQRGMRRRSRFLGLSATARRNNHRPNLKLSFSRGNGSCRLAGARGRLENGRAGTGPQGRFFERLHAEMGASKKVTDRSRPLPVPRPPAAYVGPARGGTMAKASRARFVWLTGANSGIGEANLGGGVPGGGGLEGGRHRGGDGPAAGRPLEASARRHPNIRLLPRRRA